MARPWVSVTSSQDADSTRGSVLTKRLMSGARGKQVVGGVLRLARIAKPGERLIMRGGKKKAKKPVVAELFALYGMRGVPVDDLVACRSPSFPFTITSITERVCSSATSGSAAMVGAWQRQLQLQLARLYPRATRVASDNYDPLPAWRLGVQMAALNYQTNDLPMQLNRAFFTRGGGKGFIPKPIELRPQQADGVAATAAASGSAPSSTTTTAPGDDATRAVEGGVSAGDAASPLTTLWPRPRPELCLLTIRVMAVYHLPTLGERRPCRTARQHRYVPELSGTAAPPTGVVCAAPSVAVSVHPVGGFAAVAPDVDALKRSGNQNLQRKLILPCSSCTGGLVAIFDAPVQILLEEPWVTLLRVAVLYGNDHELAYEAVVAGALRPGYRSLTLREPSSGSTIDGCALLVHVERRTAPAHWIADRDELREKIQQQAETIRAQQRSLEEAAAEVERLKAVLKEGRPNGSQGEDTKP